MGKESDIDQIHADLQFSAYEEKLNQIPGIWRELQALQGKARSSKTGATKYRRYLERCIASLKAAEGTDNPVLPRQEAELAAAKLRDDVAALCAELQIFEHAANRLPHDIDDWCAKWLPREHEALQAAERHLMDCESATNYQRVWDALKILLTAYANF